MLNLKKSLRQKCNNLIDWSIKTLKEQEDWKNENSDQIEEFKSIQKNLPTFNLIQLFLVRGILVTVQKDVQDTMNAETKEDFTRLINRLNTRKKSLKELRGNAKNE